MQKFINVLKSEVAMREQKVGMRVDLVEQGVELGEDFEARKLQTQLNAINSKLSIAM